MKPRQARRGRLTRSAEFERVYRQGRSWANRHLVLYSFPNPSAEEPRVGLSVSRRVGGAVERNRVKRVLREAVPRAGRDLLGGQDVVVVARPEVARLIEAEGVVGVERALRELVEKATAAEEKASGGRRRRSRGGAAGSPEEKAA